MRYSIYQGAMSEYIGTHLGIASTTHPEMSEVSTQSSVLKWYTDTDIVPQPSSFIVCFLHPFLIRAIFLDLIGSRPLLFPNIYMDRLTSACEPNDFVSEVTLSNTMVGLLVTLSLLQWNFMHIRSTNYMFSTCLLKLETSKQLLISHLPLVYLAAKRNTIIRKCKLILF